MSAEGGDAREAHASPRPFPEVFRGGYDDFRRHINTLIAQRAELAGEPWQVVRIDQGRLVDADGNTFECFHGTQSFGHRNPEIIRALREFLDSDAPNWFPARVNPWSGTLARVLCERSGYDRAYFASSGTEGVEAALKLARIVTRKPRILSLTNAYHGCTFGSVALMTPGVFRDPFAPHLPGAEALPHNDVDALSRAMRAGDVGALVVEPIQLEGGVHELSAAYIDAACELTREEGALLIADEVQSGLGRTGALLASAAWPRRPDAVVLGKALGGGMMAVSAMLMTEAHFDRAYGRDHALAEAHNVTFSGYGMAAVAAKRALELLDEDLFRRVVETGDWFRSELRAAIGDLPLVKEVRGRGLIVGIELVPSDHPWLSFDHFGMDELSGRPTIGLLLCHRLYRRGFFCFVCGHDWKTLRLQPRLDIDRGTLGRFVDAAREELEGLCRLM